MAKYNTKNQSFPVNHKCKVVLLGDYYVGKSSLAYRFSKDQYKENEKPTVGVAFFTKRMQINNTIIALEIWDTAGQERYDGIVPLYYRHTQAAIIVFDITNRDSFERAKQWTEELKTNVPGALKILVGNKLDLKELRSVEIDESQAFANENGLLFMETSAKTNANVTEIFEIIVQSTFKSEMSIRRSHRLVKSEKNYRIKCCGRM